MIIFLTLDQILQSKYLFVNNPEKKLLIDKIIDEFGKGLILPFKQMIKEYSETNNELKINQAVNLYINEMIPKLKEIQLLKYDVSMVEFDNTMNIYKLIPIKKQLNFFLII